ncbi:MAG TPA: nucleotide exchange factor GrpE [Streptosporangiaceae bacterium]|jgi:molecular chaperone GrpE
MTQQPAPEHGHQADAAGVNGAGDADSEQVAELRRRLAEMEDRWMRAAADLDNVRKRTARDADARAEQERVRVAALWLPVVDDLDRALEHAADGPGSMAEGVRAIRDRAVHILAELGFPRRDEAGVPFDPALHEAVSAVPDPAAPAGTVVQVLRPGYGEGRGQLRPAFVIVSTGAP